MMKRQILLTLLCGAASLTFAQMEVGTPHYVKPYTVNADRAVDTLGMTPEGASYVIWTMGDGEGGYAGYMAGSNSYNFKGVAQQFLVFGEVGVSDIIFLFSEKNDVSGLPSSVVKANIYAMNGTGTTPSGTGQVAPGTILATVNLSLAEVDTAGLTIAHFPQTINAGTEFAVGFDASSLASTDTVALLATDDGEIQFGDFSWLKLNNTWMTYSYAFGDDTDPFDFSLYIYAVVDDEFVGVGEEAYMNNSRLSFVNGNISNGQVVLAYDVVKAGRMDLVVHNSLGQAVSETAFGNQAPGTYNYTLSTEGWAPGNYYVTIKNNGRPLTKKLFVR